MKKNPVSEIVVLSNPHKRRKHHVKRRRNPSFLSGGLVANFVKMLKVAAVGAGGALANDVAFGYVKGYLPAPLTTGYGRAAAKLVSAGLVGFLAGKVLKGKGTEIAAGAATVVLHEQLTALANQFAPALPLGAYEDNSLLGYDSAPAVGAYMGAGAYMNQPAKAGVGDLLPA